MKIKQAIQQENNEDMSENLRKYTEAKKKDAVKQ